MIETLRNKSKLPQIKNLPLTSCLVVKEYFSPYLPKIMEENKSKQAMVILKKPLCRLRKLKEEGRRKQCMWPWALGKALVFNEIP